jgi:general secretion pathway protein A
MYESYWKLSSRPFDNSLGKECYYPSDHHQAALLKIRYTIEHRRSAAILSGLSGVGKSMLLNRLIEQIPEFAGPCIQLNYTCLNAGEILRYLASSVAPSEVSNDRDSSKPLRALEQFLINNCESGRHAVVLVDEAHMLDAVEHLECFRQLMNLAASHSSGEAAWTFVFCGMPSLIAAAHRNGAFNDRIAVQCILPQLTLHDTSAYIAHRLRWAGCEHPGIFQTEAVDLIHHITQGLPRKINSLCDLALMVGYAQDAGTINATLVEDIYAEMNPTAYIGELTPR